MKSLLSMAVVLLLVFAGTAFGQTGTVTGIVVDPDGHAVEGARVSLWLDNACQGFVFTDASGVFALTEVSVGTYTLKAGKARVGNAVLDGVEVADGQVTDVGVVTLEGGGPHGPHGPKYQYQQGPRP